MATGINPERNKIPAEKIESCRDMVIKLARLGCTQEEAAEFCVITIDTLKKHLLDDFNEGRSIMRRSIRKAQLEVAINEKNTQMLIWLGKCYLNQREPKGEMEHTGGLTIEVVTYARKKTTKKKEK